MRYYTFDNAGATPADMRWQREVFDFTATEAATSIPLESVDCGSCGPVIDRVTVTTLQAVPIGRVCHHRRR